MKRTWSQFRFLSLLLLIIFCSANTLLGAEDEKTGETAPPEKPLQLTLVKAVMCEEIKDLETVNETVVFSADLGKVLCFTTFDPVPEKTVIHHNWFRRDEAEKSIKLTLKPPKWSCFSEIKVRNMDAGPWRVEIVDGKGNVLRILRFSVTE